MWKTFNVYVMLQKYYYWLPKYDHQVSRNFEIKEAKQLKNLFAYEWKLGKMLDFLSPDNLEKLKKYWESPEVKKLSVQNRKNCNSV